jgi:hypothetical protein
MAKLKDIMNTNLAIPQAIETKFGFLPKLSGQFAKVNGRIPEGPDIPGVAVTVLEPPAPNSAGQPLASFFNSAPITGPGSLSLPDGSRRRVVVVEPDIASRGALELDMQKTTGAVATRGSLSDEM